MAVKKVLDTQLLIIDIETDKLVGEDHVLTLKLADSNGNGVAGQIVNVGSLGIAVTGIDGEAVFTWQSDRAEDTLFSLTYNGKSGDEYDYNACEPVEGKFTTKRNMEPLPEEIERNIFIPSGNIGTMEYGIDLGTTTSCIAKLDGDTTIVVPNKMDNKNFVASAVYIKKNGTIFVGDKAKNKIATDPKNGYAEFKLKMGSDHVYEFEKSGMKMTPVELSAEILKNLRQTVKDKIQKDLKEAVITVPVDFKPVQVQHTRDAAELAGFENVILMHEPTAAAFAYGFENSDDYEIWMVYDFGGGTFDISILKKTPDEIININNSGDAYLGGKLIDWDIVDKVFIPAIADELDLADFSRDNEKYRKQFAKLKRAAEMAKIDLSSFDTAEVDIENLFITREGDVFDFEYDMTREELDEVMEPFISRTINHCHKTLEDAGLSASDVAKIILVGGSTLSPYIHKRLEEEFHIPLLYTTDPTTVVARGAAIYAGTRIVPSSAADGEPESGFVSIELMYETLGDDIEFDVSGKVISSDGSVAGYSVEFTNNKTGYSSGRIPVADNGFFTTELLAEDEEGYNTYQIEIYDASGNIANLAPNCVNSIKYKIDILSDRPKLSHTIGFGKFGNELDVIAPKGTELPFHFRKIYKTPNAIRRGVASDIFEMSLYQGNMIKADRNTLIGHLRITGDEVKRDLPAGSEIELSVTIDESMTIGSSVYVEYLDQEFEEGMVIASEKKSRDVLVERFEEYKSRYNDILAESADTTNEQIQNYLNQIISENMIGNIETFLRNAETDPDALDIASKRINEFANVLDNIEMIFDGERLWDELKDEADQLIGGIESNIDKAEPQIKVLYEQMKGMYNNAVETRNVQLLANVKEKLQFIFAEIHEDEIISSTFLELASSGEFIDQSVADGLIQKGNSALSDGDINELRSIVGSLCRILRDDSILSEDLSVMVNGITFEYDSLESEEHVKEGIETNEIIRLFRADGRLSSWDDLNEEAAQLIEDIESNIAKLDARTQKTFAELNESYADAVETQNNELLIDVMSELEVIFYGLHEEEIITVTFLELTSSGEFTDRKTADSLIIKGNNALNNGDMAELKMIIGQLAEIATDQTSVPRFFKDSHLEDESPLPGGESDVEIKDDDSPIHAYQGNDDYIFISYAHLDSESVSPELKYFNSYGLHIWYDEGITPSTEWQAIIQEKLDNASLFIVFITPNSVESLNVRNEINYAFGIKKPFIAIHLKDTELKYGLGVTLVSVQAILKYELDDDAYVKKCVDSFRLNGFEIGDVSSISPPSVEVEGEIEMDGGFDFNRLLAELQYFNDLKELELGIIDRNEFDQRRQRHYSAFRKSF